MLSFNSEDMTPCPQKGCCKAPYFTGLQYGQLVQPRRMFTINLDEEENIFISNFLKSVFENLFCSVSSTMSEQCENQTSVMCRLLQKQRSHLLSLVSMIHDRYVLLDHAQQGYICQTQFLALIGTSRPVLFNMVFCGN